MAICPSCKEQLHLHVESLEAELSDRKGSLACRALCCRRCNAALSVSIDEHQQIARELTKTRLPSGESR